MGGNFRPLPCKKAEKALINLGFIEDYSKQRGSHRRWRKTINNKTYNVTLDCHNGEVSAKNIKSMAKQAGVRLIEFYEAAEKKSFISNPTLIQE